MRPFGHITLILTTEIKNVCPSCRIIKFVKKQKTQFGKVTVGVYRLFNLYIFNSNGLDILSYGYLFPFCSPLEKSAKFLLISWKVYYSHCTQLNLFFFPPRDKTYALFKLHNSMHIILVFYHICITQLGSQYQVIKLWVFSGLL